MNDFRIALRQHVQKPGFALTVVCTLALTIGATTAVFSVVNTVLVRARPFASPERVSPASLTSATISSTRVPVHGQRVPWGAFMKAMGVAAK